MKIEKASKKDAGEILDLQRKAFVQEANLYNDFSIEPLTISLEETLKEFDTSVFLKMTNDDIIIGSVRANKTGEKCLVRKLIVDPAHQNKGYGSQLMRAIENEFKECGEFELFTGYRSENTKHLYQKLGYKITGTKMINDRLGMVTMEKKVSRTGL